MDQRSDVRIFHVVLLCGLCGCTIRKLCKTTTFHYCSNPDSCRSHHPRRLSHGAHSTQFDSHTIGTGGVKGKSGVQMVSSRKRIERWLLIFLLSLFPDHFASLLSQRDSAGTAEHRAQFLFDLSVYTCFLGSLSCGT